HPLFDTLIEWAIRSAREAFARGTVLTDANLARPQQAWLVRSTIEDGRLESRRRLAHERLAVVVEDHLGLRSTSPAYLLVCLPPDAAAEQPDLPERSREEIEGWAYDEITEPQLRQVQAARQEECDLRREYLNTAFTDLILELQEKLNNLQEASLL